MKMLKSKKPFFIVENKVLEDRSLSLNDKWIYCCLCLLLEANEDGATDEQVSMLAEKSVEDVTRSLDRLKDGGYL